MTYYIEVTPSEPFNDVRPVWTDDMVQMTIEQLHAVAKLQAMLKSAGSTVEKMECLRLIKNTDLHMMTIMADELQEGLDKASK